MVPVSLSRAGNVLGVVLLVHAGFSTIHFKRIAPTEPLPPPDVVLEVLAALVLAVVSAVWQMPALKKVKAADIELSAGEMDVAFHCPDMMIFAHRGRSLARRRRALRARKDMQQHLD